VHGDQTSRIGNTVPIRLAKTVMVQAPTARIDYVYFQPGTIAAKTSTVAFNRPAPSGLYPSDHLGVMTTFMIEHEVE
jgi:endonuclease/exonuclease/phosphatase family metal-dependent hydrolase